MHLTEQQRHVVEADRDFLLLACPGSGKTRAAAVRAVSLMRAGTKVAVCSYTNVGVDRLRSLLLADLSGTVDPEHYVGTIHGYLLRYVVYPFAHLLGAPAGPFVREGTWPEVLVGGDPKQRIALDSFRRTKTGDLVLSAKPPFVRAKPNEIIASVGAEVLRRKNAFFTKAGVLSPDDSMWVAMTILTRFPRLAAAVARRFDELLLDEAQDTSELQLAAIHRLRATGELRSLVLVGDLEQSIYSFQGANAAACQKLAVHHRLQILELTENHRCSQQICDIAVHFCSRVTPDRAVGPNADCTIRPEVMLYPPKEPALAARLFRERLAFHGIRIEDAAVLARRWRVVDEVRGDVSAVAIEERPKAVGRIAVALARRRLRRAHVNAAQRIVAYSAWGVENLDEVEEERRADLRGATSTFIGSLPPLKGDLRTWIKKAADALQQAALTLCLEPNHSGGRTLRSSPAHATLDAAETLSPPIEDLTALTVHAIKGEEREAVMLVIHRPSARDPTQPLALWEAMVTGEDIEEEQEEERRVTFVALTRAERYCLVALPDDVRGRRVASKCLSLGFSLASAAS
jgi:DNA helicase II / ATP-dependent DNA helicase PcrA